MEELKLSKYIVLLKLRIKNVHPSGAPCGECRMKDSSSGILEYMVKDLAFWRDL